MIGKILIHIATLLLFTFSCQGKTNESKMILKCIIYPTGISYETYLLKVFDNGRFEMTYGTKTNGNEKDEFDSTERKRSKKLNEADLKIILDLQTQVMKLEEVQKTYTRKGGWEIVLISGGKKYHFYYGEQNETPLGKLIEMLKKVSPFEIDTHSWS